MVVTEIFNKYLKKCVIYQQNVNCIDVILSLNLLEGFMF